jgi:hypothetical protein
MTSATDASDACRVHFADVRVGERIVRSDALLQAIFQGAHFFVAAADEKPIARLFNTGAEAKSGIAPRRKFA